MGYAARLFVVLTFAFLLAAIPHVRASCDSSVPGCDDAAHETNGGVIRSVTNQQVSSSSAELESIGKDDGEAKSESSFRVKIDTTGYSGGSGRILRIRVEYKSETSSSKAEVGYELSPMAWIEYLDNSSTPNGYDAGTDQVVSSFALQNCQWSDFTAPGFQKFQASGANIVNLTLTLTCPKGPTTTLKFYVSDKPVTLGTELVSAKSLKFDVVMTGYPYKDTTNQSFVALEVRARGASEYEVRAANSSGSSDGFLELSDNASNSSAFFKWKSTLEQPAGAAVVVKNFAPFSGYSDVTAGQTDTRAFLSFATPQPAVLEWDPVTGVSGSSPASAVVVAFGLLIAMIVAVLAL